MAKHDCEIEHLQLQKLTTQGFLFTQPSQKKKKDIEEKRKAIYSEVKGLMVSVKS